MPVDPETIAPGKCYKVKDSAPRRVLLMQDKKLTFVLRGPSAWAVQRYHQDVDTFARAVEFEIECMTLREVTGELPTELPS